MTIVAITYPQSDRLSRPYKIFHQIFRVQMLLATIGNRFCCSKVQCTILARILRQLVRKILEISAIKDQARAQRTGAVSGSGFS